jgi:glycosyltransferase involved in cell wall biosynthesis
MAHGLPCVATAVGGVPDTLQDGVEGIIVKSGNADDLAGALATLIERPDLRLSLGTAARRRVISEFSISSLSDRCMDIYKTVLTSKRKTS